MFLSELQAESLLFQNLQQSRLILVLELKDVSDFLSLCPF